MQEELSKFEKNLAKFCGAKFCVGVSNATDGLQMLLMAAGLKKGDEILMSTHTMIATASAAYFCGAKPVLLDIKKNDFLIDPEKIEKKINKKTKAIIVTQLNGRIADMNKILKIAKKFKLLVFEDSAQALGAKQYNKKAGTFGQGGCFSFYPAKVLGCFGDGGAVITNSQQIYKRILLLRDHGRNNGNVKVWGFNARLDNIEAALLSFLLKKLPMFIKKRRKLAKMYFDNLNKIEQLSLPPAPNENVKNFDIFQNFEIFAKDRNKLMRYLKSEGIGTSKQWFGKGLHNFKDLKMGQVSKKTKIIFDNLLLLPMNISLSNKEVEYICKKIKYFYLNDSK